MPKQRPLTIRTSTDEKLAIMQKREYMVVKSNDLIQKLSYSSINPNATLTDYCGPMSLLELKLVLVLISQIKPDAKEIEEQVINIGEFCEIIGIPLKDRKHNNYYSLIKGAIEKLMKRVMWLQDKNADTETSVRWIDKAKIERRSGIIRLTLDKDLQPFLLELKQSFTKYSLHNVILMKSRYGAMLYELLRSYSYQSQQMVLHYKVSDLKYRLDATSYKNFANFKSRVLDPALRDINKYSDLKVSIECKKSGKEYTEIIFQITDLANSPIQEEKDLALERYLTTEMELDKIAAANKPDLTEKNKAKA